METRGPECAAILEKKWSDFLRRKALVSRVFTLMNCLACHVSELPDDLQVLISDFVEDSLGVKGFERLESHRFPIHHLPLAAFPRVKMWTDCRDRAYSEAMIGRQLPPILICGDQWLDGRNRVWAARHTGKSAVGCIDLSEIGVSIRFKALGRLRWKQT